MSLPKTMENADVKSYGHLSEILAFCHSTHQIWLNNMTSGPNSENV